MSDFRMMPSLCGIVLLLASCARIGYKLHASTDDGDTPLISTNEEINPDAGTDVVDAATDASASHLRLCTTWGPFGEPTQVEALNSGGSEFVSAMSEDGLTLYMDSNSLPMADGFDIFVATRSDLNSEFANPVLLRGAAQAGDQWGAKILGDNVTLFYTDLLRISMTTRASASTPWAAATVVSELDGLGGKSSLGTVSLDGLEIYFENDESSLGEMDDDDDVWRATRSSTQVAFDPPVKDLSLSTTSDDVPLLLFDNDLTLFFSSTRPMGQGNHDLWIATRPAKDQPWGNFAPITELNSAGDELSAVLTPDGQTMYFSSSRLSSGQHDIWKATRTCVVH